MRNVSVSCIETLVLSPACFEQMRNKIYELKSNLSGAQKCQIKCTWRSLMSLVRMPLRKVSENFTWMHIVHQCGVRSTVRAGNTCPGTLRQRQTGTSWIHKYCPLPSVSTHCSKRETVMSRDLFFLLLFFSFHFFFSDKNLTEVCFFDHAVVPEKTGRKRKR